MRRDIIVIGASAGGVQALTSLASTLPPNIPAAIICVLHMPPWGRANLPELLKCAGSLPAAFACDDERVQNGRIYVAPPDHHLLLEGDRIVLWRGPKENRSRPAVNVTFRSAAETYGPRVTGAILTGALDDGSAGLWWIKRRGGAVVVQDPTEAEFPDMPSSALQYVDSPYVVRLSEMGRLLNALALGHEEPD